MDPASISGIKSVARDCSAVRQRLEEWIRPGISTAEIDRKAIELIRETGAVSAVYGRKEFPGHICICLNNQVAHFSGGEYTITAEDVIKIDISLRKESWVADCGSTIYFGSDKNINHLINTNRQAIIETADSLCPGLPVSDIPTVIDYQKDKFHYYTELIGHGTGAALHTPPFLEAASKEKLKAGQIIAIEAVFALPPGDLNFKGIAIDSKTLNAHHEETVLITANGSEILTQL